MSGKNETWQWVESNYDFEPDDDPIHVFNQISKDFTDNFRRPLADILRDEQPAFIELIEDAIERSQPLSEDDEDFEELESRLDVIERRLDELLDRVVKRSPV